MPFPIHNTTLTIGLDIAEDTKVEVRYTITPAISEVKLSAGNLGLPCESPQVELHEVYIAWGGSNTNLLPFLTEDTCADLRASIEERHTDA